jgi:pimeloyl-ACP methyl ester carboxylesterase
MGGLNVLAFARRHPENARGAMAVDVAVTSSRGRDRYLRRLKGLPLVTYPDLATAKARFRLMPNEGGIPEEIVHEIAERSLARTDEGRWTLKFDRESFLGGDGLEVLDTIKEIRIPTMLVRAEHSRIMTAEAAEQARASNPRARLVTIAGAHHHVILEKPDAVARVIEEFAASL